jgi:hypothetical protein
MADTIAVSCPECEKQIKVPANLAGKKIRCKDCGCPFEVVGPGGAKAAAGKSAPVKPAPVHKVKGKAHRKDLQPDEDDQNPYAVTDLETSARCPYCAGELESAEAIVCLHCGYNTRTRQRANTRITIEHTAGDWIIWLLPGFLCVFVIFSLIGFNTWFLIAIDGVINKDDWMTFWLASGFAKVWLVVVSLFIMFFCARFAIRRLIFNYRPPENQKAEVKRAGA